ITFLSIYFKIMYDDYINVSILKRKRENENKQQENLFTFDFAKTLLRFIVKITILIALLYFFYNVGNVRNAFNITDEITNGQISVNALFNFKLVSFIGSTILLPLISGIALSVGFGILSNIRNYKSSNKILVALAKKISDENQLLTERKTIKSAIDSFKKEWDDRVPEQDMQQQFENTYLQGYKRGHRLKFGYDIYENAAANYIDELNS
ncbi:MAG TPA: hypothetical protein VK498_01425, partial [Ferruginibacter sp.]|nr:hypothetical protein [Ferruginibacter sp.]